MKIFHNTITFGNIMNMMLYKNNNAFFVFIFYTTASFQVIFHLLYVVRLSFSSLYRAFRT